MPGAVAQAELDVPKLQLMHAKVALSKRNAGTGLKVTLKGHSALLIREFDGHVHYPRSAV
jgi:hypothetical protein